MTTIPTIESDRIVLRPWRETDLDPYSELMANAERARFVGGPLSRENAWRKMASYVGHWSLRGFGVWVLEDKTAGAFVGYSGLWFPEGWSEPEVIWSLAQAFEGRGLATEAARRARTFAYTDLGWTTAISHVAGDNLASQRVALRLGAVYERAWENRTPPVAIYRHPSPN